MLKEVKDFRCLGSWGHSTEPGGEWGRPEAAVEGSSKDELRDSDLAALFFLLPTPHSLLSAWPT